MKKSIFLALLLAFTSGLANAQMTSSGKDHTYVGLGGGLVFPQRDYPLDVTGQPGMFKLFAGRMFEDYLGIQGEISGMTYATGGGNVYDVRGSLFLKLVGPLPVVQPYLLLGTGSGVKINTNITLYDYSAWSDVFTFLLSTGPGVQFEVAKGMHLYVEGQVVFNIGGTHTTVDIPVMAGISFVTN